MFQSLKIKSDTFKYSLSHIELTSEFRFHPNLSLILDSRPFRVGFGLRSNDLTVIKTTSGFVCTPSYGLNFFLVEILQLTTQF